LQVKINGAHNPKKKKESMPRVFKLWGWRAPSDSQKKWQGNLKTDFVHQAKDPIRNGVLNPKTGLSL